MLFPLTPTIQLGRQAPAIMDIDLKVGAIPHSAAEKQMTVLGYCVRYFFSVEEELIWIH